MMGLLQLGLLKLLCSGFSGVALSRFGTTWVSRSLVLDLLLLLGGSNGGRVGQLLNLLELFIVDKLITDRLEQTIDGSSHTSLKINRRQLLSSEGLLELSNRVERDVSSVLLGPLNAEGGLALVLQLSNGENDILDKRKKSVALNFASSTVGSVDLLLDGLGIFKQIDLGVGVRG